MEGTTPQCVLWCLLAAAHYTVPRGGYGGPPAPATADAAPKVLEYYPVTVFDTSLLPSYAWRAARLHPPPPMMTAGRPWQP